MAPAYKFYEELMEAYSGAKVLLSVRDPERWYESTQNIIYGPARLFTATLTFSLMKLFVPNIKRSGQVTDDIDHIIWEGTLDGNFEDRQYAIQVLNRHNEEVERLVPADRVLVYEVK